MSITKYGMKIPIYSQISTVQPLKGIDKFLHPTLNWACDYISILGLKLNISVKADPGLKNIRDRHNTSHMLCFQ